MSGNNVEKFWQKVAYYTEGIRDGSKRANVLQRHDDAMAVWIIGLAAAAVIAVPAVLNYIVDIKTLSRWMLAFSLGPFALAVLIGIRYRWILAELMDADQKFAFLKIQILETFKLNKFDDVKKLDRLENEFEDILDDKVYGLPDERKNTVKWQRRAKRLRRWMYILFGVGVVITALIAIFAP